VRQQFTTYERDIEADLDYAQARYYNFKHGRFTSVDPLMASADIINPQTFNRYVYVGNNPVNITDPTGEIWGVSGKDVQWFENEDAMKAAGFTAYTALVGMVGSQLVALNPNANEVVPAASAAAAIRQLVIWGASEALIAGSLTALGVTAVAAAAIAANIACGAPCTNLYQANSGYAGNSARDYANMARWFYGDAAPKTIFDYVDSQGNILPQYLMNENKSEEAAEQSTNTENNKVDTSANKKPEYKKPKSNISGKEGAKDKPSWVTERPLEGQNGKKFAVQEMNKKFGVGKWDRSTANGAYDKIRKWADRNFE
jgi:RHS repeat-associated protein